MSKNNSSGSEGPHQKKEPRAIRPDDAAPDHALETGQVMADHTVPGPLAPSDAPGVQSMLSEHLHDSGWYEHLGSRVRLVVLGGPPSDGRSAWFRGMILRK